MSKGGSHCHIDLALKNFRRSVFVAVIPCPAWTRISPAKREHRLMTFFCQCLWTTVHIVFEET